MNLVVLGKKKGMEAPEHLAPFVERVGCVQQRADGGRWVVRFPLDTVVVEDTGPCSLMPIEAVYAMVHVYLIRDYLLTEPTQYDLALLEDIRTNGLIDPVMLSDTGALVSGVARVWAYQQMGRERIPAWILNEHKWSFFERYKKEFDLRLDDPEAIEFEGAAP